MSLPTPTEAQIVAAHAFAAEHDGPFIDPVLLRVFEDAWRGGHADWIRDRLPTITRSSLIDPSMPWIESYRDVLYIVGLLRQQLQAVPW